MPLEHVPRSAGRHVPDQDGAPQRPANPASRATYLRRPRQRVAERRALLDQRRLVEIRHEPTPFPHAQHLFWQRNGPWIARSRDDLIPYEHKPRRLARAQFPLDTFACDDSGPANEGSLLLVGERPEPLERKPERILARFF